MVRRHILAVMAGLVPAIHVFAYPNAAHAADWQAGAPPEWRTLLADAQREGKVVVAGRPQIGEPMKQAFRRDTGITLDFLGGNGRDLDSRLLREIRAKQLTVDVMFSGATLVNLVHEGYFKPVKPQLVLPGVTGPENWTAGHSTWVDNQAQYFFIGGEYVFGLPFVNTDRIKPGTLRTWKELLAPQYRGKIASYDPTSGPGDAQGGYMVDLYGIGWFKDLYIGQKVALSRDSRQLMEWGARGIYPIVLGGVPVELEPFRKAGIGSLDVVDLEDGHGALVGGSSVVMEPVGVPHPSAAAVFLNWYASQPGQTVFSTVWRTPSTRRDVDVPTIPDFVKPKPGVQYIAQYREDWYNRYKSEYRQAIESTLGGP
jgi:ABC-type Fe3+ transport system substrate-binding protein